MKWYGSGSSPRSPLPVGSRVPSETLVSQEQLNDCIQRVGENLRDKSRSRTTQTLHRISAIRKPDGQDYWSNLSRWSRCLRHTPHDQRPSGNWAINSDAWSPRRRQKKTTCSAEIARVLADELKTSASAIDTSNESWRWGCSHPAIGRVDAQLARNSSTGWW